MSNTWPPPDVRTDSPSGSHPPKRSVAPQPDDEIRRRTGADRRGMMRLLLAAGGATAGVLAMGRSARAGDDDATPAVGANAVELGIDNTSDRATNVVYDGAQPIQDGQFRGVSLVAGCQNPPNALDGNDVYPGAVGGYGKGFVPNGVHGSTVNGTGYGIVAANLAAPPGPGGPSPKGLGVASTYGPQIHFMPQPGAVVGPPEGVHTRGELYVDAEGTMWFTVPAFGGGVRWMRIAAPSSAGAYHAIDPARAYDSRQLGYAQRGPLVRTEVRRVSVADGHDAGGSTIRPGVVPFGATAVMINVTIADPTAENFVSVVSGDRTSAVTSVVNWSPGITQTANALVVPIDGQRTVSVICGDQAGAADVIIDVFGYYL